MSIKAAENDFGKVAAGLSEMPKLLRDDDMGFFIVDRNGIVRYAYTGSYVTALKPHVAPRPIPANDEILRELERCA